MGAIVWLGPQRLKRTLREAMDERGVRGPVAAITAGWQEREEEIDEMAADVGRPVRNLRLFGRAEEILQEDLELFVAHRERTAVLLQEQEIYRLQLHRALETARDLLRRTGDAGLLEPAREAAVEAVRRIDAEHVARIAGVNAEFRETWDTATREAVLRHRTQLRDLVEGCDAVAIAGGHVGVLRNRLRLFDAGALVGDRTLLAWSAGAMCTADLVVLFHDRPPQGPGDPEILGEGLGLVPGVIPFPHASRRLDLADPTRVELLARRFAPRTCLALDEGTSWTVQPGSPPRGRLARRLTTSGRVAEAAAG